MLAESQSTYADIKPVGGPGEPKQPLGLKGAILYYSMHIYSI